MKKDQKHFRHSNYDYNCKPRECNTRCLRKGRRDHKSMHGKNFQQILMNVSCSDKLIGCAALSAAFINGIKAFGMDPAGAPLPMPVLNLSYSEIISEPKMNILKAVERIGGAVDSLEMLEEASGYGKPLSDITVR